MSTIGQQRVIATVTYGSVHQATKSKFITVDDILETIATADEELQKSDRMYIAYAYACREKNPKTHYIRGKHLLTYVKALEYFALYVLMKGDHKALLVEDGSESAATKSLSQSATVGSLLLDTMILLANDYQFALRMRIIGNIAHPNSRSKDYEQLVLHARADEYYDKIKIPHRPEDIELFLNADYLDHFERSQCPQLFELIVKRCRHLNEKASDYWEHVALPLYRDLIKGLQKVSRLGNPSDELLVEFNRLTKGVFGKNFEAYSPLARKVLRKSREVQCYLLGFNVDKWVPGDTVLDDAFMRLSDQSSAADPIGKYVAEITATNQAALKALIDGLQLKLRNTENTLMEDINGYAPYDRLTYIQGENLFVFTLEEFASLLKKRKNHWTGEDLPLFFLHQVIARLETATAYDLPHAATFQTLLKRIADDDKETDEDSDDTDDSDNEVPPAGPHESGGLPPQLYNMFIEQMAESMVREALGRSASDSS